MGQGPLPGLAQLAAEEAEIQYAEGAGYTPEESELIGHLTALENAASKLLEMTRKGNPDE